MRYMSYVLALISFFVLVFVIVACQSQNAESHQVTFENKSEWKTVGVYSMPQNEGRLTYRFGFTESCRLWSRGSTGMIYSDDYGSGWHAVKLPSAEIGSDGGVIFNDQTHGWTFDSGSFYRTVDGGKTWVASEGILARFGLTEINAVVFVNDTVGYLAGSTTRVRDKGLGTFDIGVRILSTNDGGKSWTVSYDQGNGDEIYNMVASANTVIGLLDHTKLVVKSKGSTNWETRTLGFSATDIETAPDGKIWATTRDGHLQFTENLSDWKEVKLDGAHPDTLETIAFDKSGFGVVGGKNGFLSITDDGGKTWNSLDIDQIKGDVWIVRVAPGPTIAVSTETNLFVLKHVS